MHQRLSDLLAVVPVSEDRFRSEPAAGSGFLYGGLTMGIAVVAAGETVDAGLVPISLRAAFVSFGEWGPMDVAVEHVNTSRSFAGRRLQMRQGGGTVAAVDVSFHRPEEGVDRQGSAPAAVPPADDLTPMPTVIGGVDPIELRPVVEQGERPTGRVHPYWGRVREALGHDPVAHAAGLAYISDWMVIFSPFEPGAGELAGRQSFTLEHSIWFHRPFSVDRWLLYDAVPLSQSGGRYTSRGTVHDERGALVASFVQQGFVRQAT